MGNLSDSGQHCTGIGMRRQIFCWLAANYRILTPYFPAPNTARRLPGFDASENEDRIQKTGGRSDSKPRRRNPAGGFIAAMEKLEASETGSLAFPADSHCVAIEARYNQRVFCQRKFHADREC